MPRMEKILKNKDKSRAYAVNGNERPVQKTGIDKLPLSDGTVNNLDDPSHKGVDREKRQIEKYVCAVIWHDLVYHHIILRNI